MVLQAPDGGLTSTQAAQRLREDGPNALQDAQRSPWRALLAQTLGEPMFMLLLAAGLLYLALGDLQEGLVLLALVVLVLAMTLYQTGKTERALAALQGLSSPRALVLRDGQPLRIAGREVVRGDVLILAEGDRVAADAQLLTGTEVQVDESLLTGESVPVGKVACTALGSGVEVAQTTLLGGTLLVNGHGTARVSATGPRSEMGRLGATLAAVRLERSPLKKQTARLVRVLAVVAFGVSALMVLAYGLLRHDWTGALLSGIALAMALLPQEFTVVLTVLPALGAWRLSQQRVLVRRVAAIETLGATTVLCVDKTGTLTENRMTVVQLYVPGATLGVDYSGRGALPEVFHPLVEFSILASMAWPFDPMEKAFHRLGQHFLADTEHLHRDWTLVHEYGLTPSLRAMSHVWRAAEGAEGADAVGAEAATGQAGEGLAYVVAAKGAPEAIVDLCHLGSAAQAAAAQAAQAMATQGLRVLGVARARYVGAQWPALADAFDFEFMGLLGLADPLRAEIPQAMAQCRSAGIRVLMITGDYPTTASTMARQAQLAPGDVLTGEAMRTLDDPALQERLKTVSVCARIAPAQKLRIVQALKATGEVVAMTGDGVNDAPALKAAHVGVAMGGRGTDVAREAAALVLLDDNFAALVQAVQLGRRIFDNLRKSMSYILAVHIPIAGIALLPVLVGWPVLLHPLHIAFLELVIDPTCSLVFENEAAEADVMRRPPRDAKAPLFGGMALVMSLLQGVGVLLVVVAAYVWGATWLGEQEVRAFVFVTLVSGHLALMLSNRSGVASLWTTLYTPNRTLWAVVAATLGFLAGALYWPWLAQRFYFKPLDAPTLLIAVGMGLASVLWFEAIKRRRRRRQPR